MRDEMIEDRNNCVAWVLVLMGAFIVGRPGGGLADPPAETVPAQDTAKTQNQVRQISRMLSDRSEVPITPPKKAFPAASEKQVAPGPVVERKTRFSFNPENRWYQVSFLPDQGQVQQAPLWVLPCEALEGIEAYTKQYPEAIFIVSGETSTYKDRSFLFVRSAVIQPESVPSEAVAPSVPPVSQSTTAPEGSSPDDILKTLLRKRPPKPLSLSGPLDESGSSAATDRSPDGDRGGIRIDRVVTIAQDPNSQWWEARFESDNTLQDVPLRLLPCKMLERAEYLSGLGHGFKTIRLRITGEVTIYKTQGYLLLRKVLREREMGQF
jgi:hypothetical protein